MKNVLLAGLTVLTLSFGAFPAYAGAPEVDPAKEEGKQEEQQQEEQKQEEQYQEEQNQQEQGLLALQRPRLVCYSRNLEGRVFQAFGRDAVDTGARALNQCYRRSFGLLKGTCIPAGCRRF